MIFGSITIGDFIWCLFLRFVLTLIAPFQKSKISLFSKPCFFEFRTYFCVCAYLSVKMSTPHLKNVFVILVMVMEKTFGKFDNEIWISEKYGLHIILEIEGINFWKNDFCFYCLLTF